MKYKTPLLLISIFFISIVVIWKVGIKVNANIKKNALQNAMSNTTIINDIEDHDNDILELHAYLLEHYMKILKYRKATHTSRGKTKTATTYKEKDKMVLFRSFNENSVPPIHAAVIKTYWDKIDPKFLNSISIKQHRSHSPKDKNIPLFIYTLHHNPRKYNRHYKVRHNLIYNDTLKEGLFVKEVYKGRIEPLKYYIIIRRGGR